MASLHIGRSDFDSACRRHTFVLTGITRLVSIDRNNGYDYSYWSVV